MKEKACKSKSKSKSKSMSMSMSKMKAAKPLTIVIKLGETRFDDELVLLTCLTTIGTSSIVDEETHQPILSILSMIVETAIKLLKDGHKVIIVSSGAIGVGLRRMDIDKKPQHLPKVQVCCVFCSKHLVWNISLMRNNRHLQQ
jgi:hypothetical protein